VDDCNETGQENQQDAQNCTGTACTGQRWQMETADHAVSNSSLMHFDASAQSFVIHGLRKARGVSWWAC
jgi:hypothetical protein